MRNAHEPTKVLRQPKESRWALASTSRLKLENSHISSENNQYWYHVGFPKLKSKGNFNTGSITACMFVCVPQKSEKRRPNCRG
jgi:hypothetical protein